jgi:hypothetical protein
MLTHLNGIHIALPTWHQRYPREALKEAERRVKILGEEMGIELLFMADGMKGAYLQVWDDDLDCKEAFALAGTMNELLIELGIFRKGDVSDYHFLSDDLQQRRDAKRT